MTIVFVQRHLCWEIYLMCRMGNKFKCGDWLQQWSSRCHVLQVESWLQSITVSFYTSYYYACPVTVSRRELWWSCITNKFDLHLCAELCALPENELFYTLLGRHVAALQVLSEEHQRTFRLLNFHYVRESCVSITLIYIYNVFNI